MTDNIRITTGLMFSMGLINIGMSVYCFDVGSTLQLSIGLLILGLLLIGFGIWTFYNVLIPTLLTATVYISLFIYLIKFAPSYVFNRATGMYFGIVAFTLIGAIKDAFSLKNDRGISNLEYIEEPYEEIVKRKKTDLERKIEKTKIGNFILKLDGITVFRFIAGVFAFSLAILIVGLILYLFFGMIFFGILG